MIDWFQIFTKYFELGCISLVIVVNCCCCCCAYWSSCHRAASDANLLEDPNTFRCNHYFLDGGIRTFLGVSHDPTFLWISLNSLPLNLLLVRGRQAEIIIIVKRLIQGRNSVTRVRVEPRPCDQGRRKNDAFTHSNRKVWRPSWSTPGNRLFPRKPLPLCKPLRFVQFRQESCPAGEYLCLEKLRAADES